MLVGIQLFSGHRYQSLEVAGSMQVVVAVLVAGLVASCNVGEGEKEEIEDQLSHRSVDCREAIGVVEDPGPSHRVHGSGHGFIALPAEAMQLGRWGLAGSDYEDYRFSKFGLHVRRFRQVSLEIVRAPDEAVLSYGRNDVGPVVGLTVGPCDTEGDECVIKPTEHLMVGPCGSDRGEWVVWAGGIWVTEPGCVELLATSDEEEISVWLAVGGSCDGAAAKS